MKNLMIWCTCAEDNKIVYLKKVNKWYQQAKSIFSNFNPDYYCFVDGEVTKEDLCNINKELLNINFINLIPKLGRKSIVEFQGWKRSFKTALQIGREYNYILHIENDVKILHTQKILNYITKPGYYLGKCKTYGFVQTAFMILNNKAINEKFIQHYSTMQNIYENMVFEFTFQNIVRNNYQFVFQTDRIEGHKEKFNPNYDYVCQYDVVEDEEDKNKINEYHIFSAGTLNLFNFIKTLATDLKKYKKENSKYIYHIFLLTDDLQPYKDKLNYLISDDFNIDIQSFTKYQNIIKSVNTTMHWTAYFKCLVCSLFPNLDKILYLDVDLFVINKGLEEFMDVDLTNYYVNACADIVPTYNNKIELQNCKTNTYFNSGVMMLNLKKIREGGVDKKLEEAVTGNWPFNEVQPFYHDQSLLNYLFRGKVLMSSPKFNNNILPTLHSDLNAFIDYYKRWGFFDLVKAVSDAVIIHYAGVKPWRPQDWNKYYRYLVFPYLSVFVYRYFLNNE